MKFFLFNLVWTGVVSVGTPAQNFLIDFDTGEYPRIIRSKYRNGIAIQFSVSSFDTDRLLSSSGSSDFWISGTSKQGATNNYNAAASSTSRVLNPSNSAFSINYAGEHHFHPFLWSIKHCESLSDWFFVLIFRWIFYCWTNLYGEDDRRVQCCSISKWVIHAFQVAWIELIDFEFGKYFLLWLPNQVWLDRQMMELLVLVTCLSPLLRNSTRRYSTPYGLKEILWVLALRSRLVLLTETLALSCITEVRHKLWTCLSLDLIYFTFLC